ncbi:MAG: 16S rRNA (guanine(527)-N(7))-methyltransferase RsmG [Rhodobacteraceae bacterium]|nr:16S rRNA (guanine(527)-N(7))-methyltransferase RsmG [Paracoccaceae bacterium]
MRTLPCVTDAVIDALETYEDLLRKWNQSINLVSRETLQNVWERHFLDSAQVYSLATTHSGLWADLGSGGGFPGLVVAILGLHSGADMTVTLIESDIRKATFLRAVARETGVPVTVISQRIEETPPLGARILTARALAPLDELLGFAERHLKHDGEALFQKGAKHRQEQRDALESWRFRCEEFPSMTDDQAVILRISEIARA